MCACVCVCVCVCVLSNLMCHDQRVIGALLHYQDEHGVCMCVRVCVCVYEYYNIVYTHESIMFMLCMMCVCVCRRHL